MLYRDSASFLILGILLAACASNPEKMDEVQLPAATTGLNNLSSPTHQGISTDIDAQQLSEMLTSGNEQTINDALVSIVEQGDQRFISVLIELMRAGQIGLVDQ